MATFAEGFGKGLGAGTELYETWREQKKDKATRRAMELLSMGQNYDPTTEAFDPAAQGVPLEGQPAGATVARSGSGQGFNDLGQQYFDAIGEFADIEDYAKATLAWGAVKQGHIDRNGQAALAAFDRGDTDGALEMLRRAGTFLNPGYTTEFTSDPATGNVVVAGYDKEGNPHSGGVLTRQNIADIVQMNSGPEGIEAWADDQAVEHRHQDQLGLQYSIFNADQNWKRLAEVRAESAEQRAAIQAEATLANSNLQFMIDNLALTEAQKAAMEGQVGTIMGKVDQLATFDATAAAKIEARAAGFYGPTDPELIKQESGGRWDAGQGTEYRGRIQWGRARFADAVNADVIPAGMSWEEFTSGSAESIKAQLNAEQWHWSDIDRFIMDNGLDSKLGQKDANGTPITWAGLRFAAHIAGNPGMLKYVTTGEETPDKNGKGPSDYMRMGLRAAKVGPDAAPAPGQEGIVEPGMGLGTVSASGEALDSSGKPIPHAMAVDPWFYEEPNANGEVYERKGLRAGMALAANDLKENNPGVTDDQVAGIVYDAFGAKPRSQLILGEGGEPDYISDGVSKLVLSPQVADTLNAFNEANAKARARFEADRNPLPYETFDQSQPPTQEAAIPAPAAPVTAPGVPGAAAAATAPAPAQAGIPAPPQAAAPTPPVDDTAVRTAPAAGKNPSQVPPAIASVPQLAQAVQQWIASGRPPEGAGALGDLLMSLQGQIPQDVFFAVQQELIDFVHAGFMVAPPPVGIPINPMGGQ